MQLTIIFHTIWSGGNVRAYFATAVAFRFLYLLYLPASALFRFIFFACLCKHTCVHSTRVFRRDVYLPCMCACRVSIALLGISNSTGSLDIVHVTQLQITTDNLDFLNCSVTLYYDAFRWTSIIICCVDCSVAPAILTHLPLSMFTYLLELDHH